MNDNAIHPGSPQPNVYGPLTPRQMFERTAALLRGNFKLFFGIVLVVIGIEIVIGGVLGGGGIWMGRSGVEAAPMLRALFIVPLSLLGGALIYIFTQIIQGALFLATQAKLANAPMTVGEACRLAAEKAGRLIGISLLVALRMFGYLLLFYFAFAILAIVIALIFGGFGHLAGNLRFHSGMAHTPAQLLAGGALVLVVLLAFLAYIAVLLWLVIRYAVAVPAALAENLPITDAIRRSIQLSHRSKGRLLALFLVVGCVWFAFFAVTLPIQLMAAHFGAMHPTATAGTVSAVALVVAAFRILFSWLVITFLGVATALCYYDLRVRKEGFGAVAAPVLELPSAPLPPVTDGPIEDLPVS